MTNKLLLTCIVVTGLVLLAGCGQSSPKPDGFPQMVPCVLTITQEGAPLSSAMVTLIPADGAKDWQCSASTDQSGVAKMYTYGRAEGAPKGKFKVIVMKSETDPSKYTMPNPDDSAAMEKYMQNTANEKLNSYSLVEAVYMDPDKTPLELEITGKTEQTLDVGKKVKAKLSD